MEIIENSKLTEAVLYRKAKKQARAIRSFYANLICYCIVIPTLIFVNLTFSPEFYWFIFSAFGWGIGLAFHGMAAFNYHPFLGSNWEERKINEFIERERNSKNELNNY